MPFDTIIRGGTVATVADTFRVGCIGALGEKEMTGALDAIRATLAELGVGTGARARAA